MARRMAAGELIVIDVVTSARSMPANRSSTSARVSTATPQRPTSPRAWGSSESRPIRVGRSKAVDSPSPPARRISWKRTLVSSAVPSAHTFSMPSTVEVLGGLQQLGDVDHLVAAGLQALEEHRERLQCLGSIGDAPVVGEDDRPGPDPPEHVANGLGHVAGVIDEGFEA